MDLKQKVYKNALIGERLYKLNKEERQKIILELCKNQSERQLSEEIGIPRSTINDWKTLRQDNTGSGIHISLSGIYRKLKNMNPNDINDWGRIEMIKERCAELLRIKNET